MPHKDRGTTSRAQFLDRCIEDHLVSLHEAEAATLATIEQVMGQLLEDLERRQALAGVQETQTSRLLENTIQEARGLYQEAHRRIETAVAEGQKIAAATRAERVHATLASIVDDSMEVVLHRLSAPQIAEVVAQPYFGWTTYQWTEWHTVQDALRIDRELRASYFSGEGTRDAARRLRKVTDLTKRESITTAQTAINSASNAAAQASYEANRDVIANLRWVATLDDKTCPQCGPLDGRTFSVDRGPRPPAHPNCRCMMAPEPTRRYLPGKAAPIPTWEDWMTGSYSGLTPEGRYNRQRLTMGRPTADAIKAGQITIQDLVGPTGKRRKLPEAIAYARKRRRAE